MQSISKSRYKHYLLFIFKFFNDIFKRRIFKPISVAVMLGSRRGATNQLLQQVETNEHSKYWPLLLKNSRFTLLRYRLQIEFKIDYKQKFNFFQARQHQICLILSRLARETSKLSQVIVQSEPALSIVKAMLLRYNRFFQWKNHHFTSGAE